MTPGERFQQVLKDNNLYVSLAPQRVRKIDDGSLIIENPQLLVDWISPEKEEPAQQPTTEAAPVEAAQPEVTQEVAPETTPEISTEQPHVENANIEATPAATNEESPSEGGAPSESQPTQ